MGRLRGVRPPQPPLRPGLTALPVQLHEALAGILSVQAEDDGSLTIRHGGTAASLRTVTIADGLEMVSITQVLAWDLPDTAELRKTVAAQANTTLLGTVALSEQPGRRADVMLRYNFPASGLGNSALQTLVLMVLDTGTGVRRVLLDGDPRHP